jgi:ABC-type lipoprotein export system ATPase subunit
MSIPRPRARRAAPALPGRRSLTDAPAGIDDTDDGDRAFGRPLLAAVCLSRRFEASRADPGSPVLVAVDRIDLEVRAGELVVLMGPSGCGKSTLLNLLGLLDHPTSGDVTFEGESTARMDDARRARIRRLRIGHVFQFFHLLPHLTLEQNVELPLVLDGRPSTETAGRAREALARFGLSDRCGDFPARLSGGQMQRVAIARALVAGPAVVLADEPTGSLDSATGREILETLAALAREPGRAVVMATHSAEAARIGTRRVGMQDGRLVAPERAGRGA